MIERELKGMKDMLELSMIDRMVTNPIKLEGEKIMKQKIGQVIIRDAENTQRLGKKLHVTAKDADRVRNLIWVCLVLSFYYHRKNIRVEHVTIPAY